MGTTRHPPTAAELAILRVLWEQGPSTVREVHGRVYEGSDVGYTSALKLLQNMHAKGLVRRKQDARQHVYAAAVQQRSTLNGVVRHWIESSFAGSSAELAMQALDAKPVNAEELARLKELIRQMEEREAKS